MINLIQLSSAPAMRAVTKKLATLWVTDFPGENVLTASSFIKGAIQQLEMNTLQDIICLIERTFEVRSTDEFNEFIKSLYINHEMELKQLTSNTYLLE